MAETNYPQIPRTVWLGVRDQLLKSPTVAVTEDLLAAKLDVQLTAARQYIKELAKVGVLDENGKATELAKRWRLDDEHAGAIREILQAAYGEELMSLAPPGEAKRDVVKRWFMQKGLGEGSAGNRAATYLMIANSDSREDVVPGGSDSASAKKPRSRKPQSNQKPDNESNARKKTRAAQDSSAAFVPSVNLNLQIHISAEATAEQIDAIFASMRKHLA